MMLWRCMYDQLYYLWVNSSLALGIWFIGNGRGLNTGQLLTELNAVWAFIWYSLKWWSSVGIVAPQHRNREREEKQYESWQLFWTRYTSEQCTCKGQVISSSLLSFSPGSRNNHRQNSFPANNTYTNWIIVTISSALIVLIQFPPLPKHCWKVLN